MINVWRPSCRSGPFAGTFVPAACARFRGFGSPIFPAHGRTWPGEQGRVRPSMIGAPMTAGPGARLGRRETRE